MENRPTSLLDVFESLPLEINAVVLWDTLDKLSEFYEHFFSKPPAGIQEILDHLITHFNINNKSGKEMGVEKLAFLLGIIIHKTAKAHSIEESKAFVRVMKERATLHGALASLSFPSELFPFMEINLLNGDTEIRHNNGRHKIRTLMNDDGTLDTELNGERVSLKKAEKEAGKGFDLSKMNPLEN